MKLKDILSNIEERWVVGTRSDAHGAYREIFMNPDRNDIRDIEEFGGYRHGDNVRFIAVKDSQNVYVSSADVFHRTIAEEVDDLLDIGGVTNNFSGMGNIEGSKIEVTDFSDVFIEFEGYEMSFQTICEDILDGKYDWMERYNFDLGLIKEIAEDELEELKKYWEEED